MSGGRWAGAAAVVCGAVECSQLYHAPWIDSVRRTWLGRVTLGTTFGWGDLAVYLVGIAFGTAAEWVSGRVTGDGGGRLPGRRL